MKDMNSTTKLSLIDKKYTVEMDSHEYIKYMAYKLGIPVDKSKKDVTLKEYYTDMVDIFGARLSNTKNLMSVADIQEYAMTLNNIALMFVEEPLQTEIAAENPKIMGKIETPVQIHPLDKCTYIPSLNIYVYEYAKDYSVSPYTIWCKDQYGDTKNISEEEYRIINDTVIASEIH
jgi:hypothetical protein